MPNSDDTNTLVNTQSSDDDTVCIKYQQTVINLLVLQLKLFGASKRAIDEALAPLKQ